MARDLHDTVIQRLFALGLTLQGLAAGCPTTTASKLSDAVTEIDRVITQVRSTIYELGMGDESRGIRDDIAILVRELDAVVGFEVELTFDGPVDSAVSGPVLEHLLAALREALDQRRQARPREPGVGVRRGGRDVLSPDPRRQRHRHSRRREGSRLAATGCRTCGAGRRSSTARFTIDDNPGGGTVLTWIVPLGT